MGAPEAGGGGPNPVLVGGLALLVAAVIGGGAYLLMRDDDTSPDEEVTTVDEEETSGPDPKDGSGETGQSDEPDFSDLPTPPEKAEDFSDAFEEPDGSGPGPGTELDFDDVSVGPPSEPPVTGDTAHDRVAEDCFDGDMFACDDLVIEADPNSPHSEYGYTCGGRVDEIEVPPCILLDP